MTSCRPIIATVTSPRWKSSTRDARRAARSARPVFAIVDSDDRNQFRGHDTTGSADGPQHQHAHGKRDGRDGPARSSSIGVCASAASASACRRRDTVRSVTPSIVSPDSSSMSGGASPTTTLRADDDQRAAAFERTGFDRVGRPRCHQIVEHSERRSRPARPAAAPRTRARRTTIGRLK